MPTSTRIGAGGLFVVRPKASWYVKSVDAKSTQIRGRRSLNGAGDSPQLRLRLPDELRLALHRRAAHEGVTVSELARRILSGAMSEQSQIGPEEGSRSVEHLIGPLGRRLRAHRREVVEAAAIHGLTNVRVFGSVARGEDRPDSDIDLLADLPDGMGLIGLGRARSDLERILDARVDLIPGGDVKLEVASSAVVDALPL